MYKTYCELFLRGTEILSLRYLREFRYNPESGIRIIDCIWSSPVIVARVFTLAFWRILRCWILFAFSGTFFSRCHYIRGLDCTDRHASLLQIKLLRARAGDFKYLKTILTFWRVFSFAAVKVCTFVSCALKICCLSFLMYKNRFFWVQDSWSNSWIESFWNFHLLLTHRDTTNFVHMAEICHKFCSFLRVWYFLWIIHVCLCRWRFCAVLF